jgi:hypothetical protein
MGLVTGIAREWAGMAREAADGLGTLITHPLRSLPARNKPGPLWPRAGDTRTRAGETEVWWHGWQPRKIEEGRTVTAMAPNPAWGKAQRARQRGTRNGRSRT